MNHENNIFAKIEYDEFGEVISEDYTSLEEYLDNVFLPYYTAYDQSRENEKAHVNLSDLKRSKMSDCEITNKEPFARAVSEPEMQTVLFEKI